MPETVVSWGHSGEADGMERRDFFISYTHSNKVWAIWIANVLNKNGYSAYYQEGDISPGDSFIAKMNEFLKNSDNFPNPPFAGRNLRRLSISFTMGI